MTSEIELFGKDSVKLGILKEITSGNINISLSLNGGVYQDYLSQIHHEGSRMQVLGKFNLSEDPSGEVLTVRPIMVSGSLKVTFGFSEQPSDTQNKLSIFRSATKSVEREYDISEMLTSIEFIPQGNIKYLLRLTYGGVENDGLPAASEQSAEAVQPSGESTENANLDRMTTLEGFNEVFETPAGDIPSGPKPAPDSQAAPEPPKSQPTGSNARDPELDRINGEIKAAEEKLRQLKERRKSANEILNKLEREYQKDYDEFQKELEEYKSRTGIDQSVLDYYKDNDIVSIEELFADIASKLDQAEKQIGLVILGRQEKTKEIENEVKSNKRQ